MHRAPIAYLEHRSQLSNTVPVATAYFPEAGKAHPVTFNGRCGDGRAIAQDRQDGPAAGARYDSSSRSRLLSSVIVAIESKSESLCSR